MAFDQSVPVASGEATPAQGQQSTAQRRTPNDNLEEELKLLEMAGREEQRSLVGKFLANDKDLLIAGAPGSGRRTLVWQAAQDANARILEVDCIRATSGECFINLLCEGLGQTFLSDKAAQDIVQNWVGGHEKRWFELKPEKDSGKWRLELGPEIEEPEIDHRSAVNNKHQDIDKKQDKLFQAFQLLIDLLDKLAVNLSCRLVLVLENFPHIRSWDRVSKDRKQWEQFLRSRITEHKNVSYVLMTTTEINNEPDLETVLLTPLSHNIMATWVRALLSASGLTFNPFNPEEEKGGLQVFLETVDGHVGNARALARRLRLMYGPKEKIGEQQVKEAVKSLLKDLRVTFETLLLLLPPGQVQLLESLARDPTEKPHSKEYIRKHFLSKGGTLQGAITGLQQKGLIYGPEQSHSLTLPLMAEWIRQRLRPTDYLDINNIK